MTQEPFVLELLIGKEDLIKDEDEKVVDVRVVGSVIKREHAADEVSEPSEEGGSGSVVGKVEQDGAGQVAHGGVDGLEGDLHIFSGGGVFLKKVMSGKDSTFTGGLCFSLQFFSSDP